MKYIIGLENSGQAELQKLMASLGVTMEVACSDKEAFEHVRDAKIVLQKPLEFWLWDIRSRDVFVDTQIYTRFYETIHKKLYELKVEGIYLNPYDENSWSYLEALYTGEPEKENSSICTFVDDITLQDNKYWRFIKEWVKWNLRLRKKRDFWTINNIYYHICRRCFAYNDNVCSVCSCNINNGQHTKLNKIAWATTSCPLNRW